MIPITSGREPPGWILVTGYYVDISSWGPLQVFTVRPWAGSQKLAWA